MPILGRNLIGFGREGGGGGLYAAALAYSYRQANTAAGGSSVGGSWQKYPLNTEDYDPASLGVLASSQLTLQAGTYQAVFSAVLRRPYGSRLRLRDVTNSLTLALSHSQYNDINTVFLSHHGSGRFTLAAAAALELQYFVQVSQATTGLGQGYDDGEVEVYGFLTLLLEN